MSQDDAIIIELGLKELAVLVVVGVLLVGSAYSLIESSRPSMAVVTDKGEYRAGDVVAVRGVLRGGWATLPGVDVGVDVRGPSSEILWIDHVITGSDGSYISSFRIPETALGGDYTVHVSAYIAKGSARFRVVGP